MLWSGLYPSQKHLAWLLCSGIIHGRLALATEAPFICIWPIPLSCALPNSAFGLPVRVISRQHTYTVEVTGCRCLVVQVKWKWITWKNCWGARFADKHSFRSQHSMKKSMKYSNTLSVSCMFISLLLTKFYEYQLGFWELQTQMYPWISCTLDFWLQFCEKKCSLYMDVYGTYTIIANQSHCFM